MIVSSVITVICFIVIMFELVSNFFVLRKCKRVRCTVVSSEKICEREDDCIVDEYCATEVDFLNGDHHHTASLRTNMICQKGQILTCYYYPKKNVVFRKRDIRSILNAHSIQTFSVGFVFLMLNMIFQMTSLGKIIIYHAFEAFTVVLILPFVAIGIWLMVYDITASERTRESKVKSVNAEIVDVIRKSKRHRENIHFMYYPIYDYSLNGIRHTVQSKLAKDSKPVIGSKESILVDLQKGSVVEYKDVDHSFWLGAFFITLALLMLCSVIFL